MLQDTQTQVGLPTLPANDHAGFKVPSLGEVLSDVVYDEPVWGQDRANEAQKIDQIRGFILERVHAIRELAATRKRYLAEAGGCRERLATDTALNQWQRMEIEGLAELREAQADYCEAMSEHHRLSVWMFYQMLHQG